MEELNINWVRFHRKAMNSTVWQKAEIWYVWSWCLFKANFKDSEFVFNGIDIKVKRGQFITGRSKALQELPDITARKWRNIIQYLKTTNRITTKTTNRFTVITVCNYDVYQNDSRHKDQQYKHQNGQQGSSNRPTKDQQLATYKKDKNVKNEKNVCEETPPTLEEVKIYFNECGYKSGKANKAWHYYNANKWTDKKGNKIKNWKQQVTIWFDEIDREMTLKDMLAERDRYSSK